MKLKYKYLEVKMLPQYESVHFLNEQMSRKIET